MVNFNYIQEVFDKSLHQTRFRRSLLKEYFQYKILDIIYRSNWSENLIFLGGTSLRILQDFRRFSDDLDFDITGNYSEKNHEELCAFICKQLAREGIEAEIDTDKKLKTRQGGAYTRYVHLPQMLFRQGILNDPRKKFFLKIDAQRHNYGDFSYTPEERIINKFGIFTAVKTTPADIILSMKYCSILERAKGRDFYDITELAGITKPSHKYLENRFAYGKLKEAYYGPVHLKEKITEKFAVMTEKEWSEKVAEIEKYLFDPSETAKVKLFYKWISDPSFLRSFGLDVTGDNRIIDPLSGKIKKFRLNRYHPKYVIPIPHGAGYYEVLPKERRIKLLFTNSSGEGKGWNLNTSPDRNEIPEKYYFLEFSINPDDLTPQNIEVQFYSEKSGIKK